MVVLMMTGCGRSLRVLGFLAQSAAAAGRRTQLLHGIHACNGNAI